MKKLTESEVYLAQALEKVELAARRAAANAADAHASYAFETFSAELHRILKDLYDDR